MARHKDSNWNLDTPPGLTGAGVAVLMDIRDELKALNRVMQCSNVATGFRALAKIAERDELAFKRRVAYATAKRVKRAAR